MHDGTRGRPFRLRLIFHDRLKNVEAVPLNGVPSCIGNDTVGGMLHGKEDVVSFLSEIGVDSAVQTRQLTRQPLTFKRVFNMLPPEQIIGAVEERFAAGDTAELKILEGRPLTERDDAALSYFEDIALGSTKLPPTEGFRRMRERFERQPRSSG